MRGCLSRRSGSSALIAYEDQKGENRVEVLTFRNSLVTERPRHIRRKLARRMRLQAPSGLGRMSTDPKRIHTTRQLPVSRNYRPASQMHVGWTPTSRTNARA